jgi:hypothetical protein
MLPACCALVAVAVVGGSAEHNQLYLLKLISDSHRLSNRWPALQLLLAMLEPQGRLHGPTASILMQLLTCPPAAACA